MDPSSYIDNDMVSLNTSNATRDMVHPVDGHRCYELCQPPCKPSAIAQIPQRAIQSWRRYFQCVRVVELNVSIENRAQISADSLTIVETDGLQC